MKQADEQEKLKEHETEELEMLIRRQLWPVNNIFAIARKAEGEYGEELLALADTVFHTAQKKIEQILSALNKHVGVIYLDVIDTKLPGIEVFGATVKK